jgi:hypothetical protein
MEVLVVGSHLNDAPWQAGNTVLNLLSSQTPPSKEKMLVRWNEHNQNFAP